MATQQSTERWLPIPGFEGHYSVSDRGAIDNLLDRRNQITTRT